MSEQNAETAQMLTASLLAIEGVASADVRGNADSYIAHVAVRSGCLGETWEALLNTIDRFERKHNFPVDLSPRELTTPPEQRTP